MAEEWTRWTPIEGLANKYYLETVSEHKQALTVTLCEESNIQKKVRISFGFSAEAHRDTYETYRHALICELDERYGKDFYVNWVFFKVNNSAYVRWLTEQSYGMSGADFMHFSFLTSESVLDVLATKNPIVELIETASL